MKKITIAVIVLCLLGCKSTEVDNNGLTNSLFGVVFDKKSNPVQNAVLTITADNLRVIKVTTDIDGRFFIPELEFGHYIIEVKAYRSQFTTADIDHFDIENVLIIRVPTFEDLITDMELLLRDNQLINIEHVIVELEKIDFEDVYFNYLKAIYLIKTDEKDKAREILLSINDRNYKYINILLEDIKDVY